MPGRPCPRLFLRAKWGWRVPACAAAADGLPASSHLHPILKDREQEKPGERPAAGKTGLAQLDRSACHGGRLMQRLHERARLPDDRLWLRVGLH